MDPTREQPDVTWTTEEMWGERSSESEVVSAATPGARLAPDDVGGDDSEDAVPTTTARGLLEAKTEGSMWGIACWGISSQMKYLIEDFVETFSDSRHEQGAEESDSDDGAHRAGVDVVPKADLAEALEQGGKLQAVQTECGKFELLELEMIPCELR